MRVLIRVDGDGDGLMPWPAEDRAGRDTTLTPAEVEQIVQALSAPRANP
ncbi:hypothetical protein [Actinoallomurus sp. NPDC050550]